MLVDTHCHVNIMVKEKFDVPLTEKNFELAQKIYEQAAKEQVDHIINAGTSITEDRNCIQLAQKNKHMYAAVGIHPCDMLPNWHNDLKKVIEFILHKKENKIVAIGECGLDLYHQKYNVQQQKDLFKAQVELSLEYNLPMTVHMRQATDEMVSCLELFKQEKLKGVMHCFSEDKAFADYVINLGFSIGIGSTITYPKNNELRELVAKTPLDKIVLETDAPFLPPQIIRGKQNHPKYIRYIADYIAKLKKISFDTVADQTTDNACTIFGLGQYI
ncbi:TatD family hydrolase [Candidatus Dependentiae bacterium]